MLEKFHYDSGLIGGSLMVHESRLIADLLLREEITAQWHRAIQIDNILQKRTTASAQRNADQRINLDLDDGVKVNYGKFGDLLAEVQAIT